jgi:DNA-binding beta-propeller fold protein YncE
MMRFSCAIVLSLACVLSQAQAAPQFVAQWGQNAPGGLVASFGIAAGGGYAYVSDQFDGHNLKFTEAGQYVGLWNNRSIWAFGLALDGNGRVYMVDYGRKMIDVFNTDGTFLFEWGGPGSGAGQFSNPRRLVVDPSGFVHVTDGTRIQSFTHDGAFVSMWAVGQVDLASGIALGPSGVFYVADENEGRVAMFDSAHNLLGKFGTLGVGEGQLNGPTGIAVDPSGNVYVPSHLNNRVDEFTASGTFIQTLGPPGSGPGEFNDPVDVAVDDSGGIYVLDLGNTRVEVFRDLAVPVARSSWGQLKAKFR